MDERTLCRIWQAQRFDRTSLRTSQGDGVAVVYRGRPERSPGPDFREAMLVIDGELRQGDVELHVRASDWSAHRHDRDRRYDRVILHVVFRQDDAPPARTTRGQEVPCLVLEGMLGEPDRWADLGRAVDEDCRRRVAALSDGELGGRLDRLGDERFLQKAAALEADLVVADPEQVFYERLTEVLGYGQNRRPFLELARRLPLAYLYALAHRRPRAERVALCQSLLFGVAGLLPSQRLINTPLDWVSAQHVDELERTWATFGQEWQSEVMGAGWWSFGVRPLNSPPRRIGAMSHLFGACLEVGPLEVAWRALADGNAALAVSRLAAALAVEAPDSYWASYFDFGRPSGARAVSLIGRERALAAVVNVCLPFALACSANSGAERLSGAAWAAYRATPRLALNQVTRWMVAEVLGPSRGRVVDSARRQQGLHHVYRTGCDQLRCGNCPLLAA